MKKKILSNIKKSLALMLAASMMFTLIPAFNAGVGATEDVSTEASTEFKVTRIKNGNSEWSTTVDEKAKTLFT